MMYGYMIESSAAPCHKGELLGGALHINAHLTQLCQQALCIQVTCAKALKRLRNILPHFLLLLHALCGVSLALRLQALQLHSHRALAAVHAAAQLVH